MAEVPNKRVRREETWLATKDSSNKTGSTSTKTASTGESSSQSSDGVSAAGESAGGGVSTSNDPTNDVVPGEKAKLSHEKVDIRPTKNIKMKQHLCVKHALPKTRLTNAILYENVSQGRHLEMKLAGLQHDKHRSSFTMDLNKRAFMAQQDRKRHKWKREDEVRIAGMNLPSLSPQGDKASPSPHLPPRPPPSLLRKPSMKTIYHMADTDGRAESADAGRKPLLPMMKIRRERTEIVSHHDKVFVTKLPSVVEIDQKKMDIHDTYCGKALLDRGMPSRDDRFRRLHTTLSPAILKSEDEYPKENLSTKSRMSKYVGLSPAACEPFVYRPETRVMVASRGKPNAQGLEMAVTSAPGCQRTHDIDYVTETKTSGKEIIKLFKSNDIKSLARSLTTDATGMKIGMGTGTGKGKDTDRSVTRACPQNVYVPVVDVFFNVKTKS